MIDGRRRQRRRRIDIGGLFLWRWRRAFDIFVLDVVVVRLINWLVGNGGSGLRRSIFFSSSMGSTSIGCGESASAGGCDGAASL